MFTVTFTGKKSGAISVRYADARKALGAYRQMENDGATSLSVTDNRVHHLIDLRTLEQEARTEETASSETPKS